MFKKESPITGGKVDTLVGPGTTIEGKVQAAGILRVEGRIRGEVVSEGDVIVGEKGEIRANIKARHVTIAGRVAGNISASGRMHLTATGSLQGDVDASTISIEEGAHFKGACRMAEPSSGKERHGEPEPPKPSQSSETVSTGPSTFFHSHTTDKKEYLRPLADAPQ